jgi:hypothetical protein
MIKINNIPDHGYQENTPPTISSEYSAWMRKE